jgi:hypothetical protein
MTRNICDPGCPGPFLLFLLAILAHNGKLRDPKSAVCFHLDLIVGCDQNSDIAGCGNQQWRQRNPKSS